MYAKRYLICEVWARFEASRQQMSGQMERLDRAPLGGFSACLHSSNSTNKAFFDIYDSCRCLKGSHTCSFGYTPISKGYFMAPYILVAIMLLK